MKLACQQCGTVLPPADVNLAEGVCFCARCQEYFKISALLTDDAVITRIPKPAHSTLEFVADSDSLGLIVPPGGNRSTAYFFLFFALFWNAISWAIFVLALRDGQIFPVLFLLPFLAIGVAVAIGCLFAFRGEFTLSVDRTECRAIWSLFKWHYTRRVPTADITAVIEDIVYTKNYRPVHGIAIKHGTKTLKFGSTFTDGERKWIVAEFRHFLKLPA